jgi:hypothetical protein
MGILARHAELDVRRSVNRRVPGCVVVLFDFGPQPPKVLGVPAQTDARRLRKYEIERALWEKETGNKPVDCGFNSVDATEIRLREPARWRTSATATVEDIAEPRSAGPVVINLVAQSGVQLGGFWLLDIVTGNKYVVFSPDYVEWQSRDLRYQPTTPS